MSKNKKTLVAKGLGASALAIATIASGLSFGAASATAETEPASTKVVGLSGVYKTFYGKNFKFSDGSVDPEYWWIGPTNGNGSSQYMTGSSKYESVAAEKGKRLSTLSTDEWRHIQVENTNLCFTSHSSSGVISLYTCDKSGESSNQWYKLDADGNVISAEHSRRIVGIYRQGSAQGGLWLGSGAQAEFGGDWASDGTALNASVSFDPSLDSRAVVAGTTVASGSVEVRRGSTVVGTGTADANGDFRIAVLAPNKAGDDKLTVALVENGADKKTIEVTAAYGAGVSITDPANNADVSGSYDVRGSAQAGSTVTLKVGNGAARPITVNANGQWSQTVTLPKGETRIVATQKSKGANTTTSTVVVNPGQSNIAPLVIETPANGSTVETPSKRIEFAGTAQPESRVLIKTETGRTIVDTFADADGNWSKVGDELAFGVPYRLITEYTPQGESTVTGEHRVTLKDSDPGVVQDARIDTPAAESTVIAPDGLVDFAGVGATGTKVTIHPMRGLDRVVGTATVGKDGTWKISNGSLNPDNGDYNVHVKYTLPNGTTVEQDRHFFIQRTEGVVQDARIDTPAAESTVIAPDGLVDFAGVGATGTKVTIHPMRGLDRVVGTATVGKDGTWKISNGSLNPDNGDYNVHVKYTLPNGTTVEQDRHFFIKREASTDLPYVVGTPAEGSDVTLANYRASDNNGEATISGTGKTGGMVKVWNYESKNRIVIKGGEVLKVDENGKWSGVGELAGNMEYKLHIEYFAPGVDLDGEPTSVVTRSFNTVAPTK